MQKIVDSLYKIGEKIIKYLFLIFTAVLAVGALVINESADNMIDQNMVLSWDKLYLSIPLTLLLALVVIGLGVLSEKKIKKYLPLFITCLCLWYFALGAILIVRSITIPAADAMSVYFMADQLSQGNLGIIDTYNSYMSYYPQQIGLTSFLAIFFKIIHILRINVQAYHIFKLLYLVMICVSTYLQYRIVDRLWKNERANCIFLFFSAINLPLVFYSTYIYSEVPSFFFFTIGAWILTELLAGSSNKVGTKGVYKNKNDGMRILGYAILSSLTFTAAVFIRKNVLVLIIAVVIVALFQMFKSKRLEWLAYAVVCMACCLLVFPIVISCFEKAAGSRLTSGVTAKSYFAMGMQEGGRGPGWYNGFNYNTYEASGLNPEIANEVSSAAIQERVDYFKENPGYAVKFYARKFSTQWYDGTYACLQATWATVGNRSAFFNELYYGKYTYAFILYCGALQNLMYIGAFAGVVSLISSKDKDSFWKYLFAIGVIGGLLFHTIWEANSRYIVTYSWLLIPYSALGLSKVPSLFLRKKH